MSWIDEYLTAWVGERFVLNLRVDLFSHLQRLSLAFFERRQLGDIMSRLGGDVSEIETLVLTGVNMALTYAFQILFFTGMLFYLDWRLDRRPPAPGAPRHRADPARPVGACPPLPRRPEPATGALITTALPTVALPTTPSAWFDPDPPTVRLRLPLTGSRPQKGRHRRSVHPFPTPAAVPEQAGPEPVVHRPAAAH